MCSNGLASLISPKRIQFGAWSRCIVSGHSSMSHSRQERAAGKELQARQLSGSKLPRAHSWPIYLAGWRPFLSPPSSFRLTNSTELSLSPLSLTLRPFLSLGPRAFLGTIVRKQNPTTLRPRSTGTADNKPTDGNGPRLNDEIGKADTSDESSPAKSSSFAGQSATVQFEDDEDLYKLEQERMEFISSHPVQATNDVTDSVGVATLGADAEDNEEQMRSRPLDDLGRRLTGDASSARANEWAPNGSGETRGPRVDMSGSRREPPDVHSVISSGTRHSLEVEGANLDLDDESGQAKGGKDSYFAGSLDSTRFRLAKLVHKVAPELSCYTSYGEHYRGNVSITADRRVCSNWLHVRSVRLGATPSAGDHSDDNHNYCRNPTRDPRGPWCFVRHTEPSRVAAASNTSGAKLEPQARYVQRACAISACSDFLWVYIVAPPVGLLLLLMLLLTWMVRSVRRSHYNSVFAERKRKALPGGLSKLLGARRGPFAPKKFGRPGKKCGQSDDDIFEIVDDIDWSDGTAHSLSPKSTESLRLNSASNEADSTRLTSCKSSNPLYGQTDLMDVQPPKLTAGNLVAGNRSLSSQVGPTFATLRCHMRGRTGKTQLANSHLSSFADRCDLALGKQAARTNEWLVSPSSSSSISSASTPSDANKQAANNQSNTTGSHLISCSTTTEDIEALEGSSTTSASQTATIRVSSLPRLSASSVAISSTEQPIYEGKFSHVRSGQVKRVADTSSASNDIGSQVAVSSLKSLGEAFGELSVFNPAALRVRHLNHLNLLKLVGWFTEGSDEEDNDEIGLKSTGRQAVCALVFDMAQLVDLSDWLKQQCKDSLTNSGGGSGRADLGTRRNLTCFSKQIALAVDYLHDIGIVYKDLACRNCFLDPSKMLVKLASFNIELASSDTNNADQAGGFQNLKSMIRPKYLLDYYVIDSRPSDCQLLPLSWIPLESILFNKFNKQTDVWSFGCLLYELFSLGEVAYFGYSSKQVIDAVRSNLMPPKPILCPNGIYSLMCKCLSDIPAIRPNVKQIYEQLNLYSGQCSSFLDHHLCSLANSVHEEDPANQVSGATGANRQLMADWRSAAPKVRPNGSNGSITKTKSYANIGNFTQSTQVTCGMQTPTDYMTPLVSAGVGVSTKPEVAKIPLSRSINLSANRMAAFGAQNISNLVDNNHYDEPIIS